MSVELPFEMAEYRDRMRRAREEMVKDGYDALLVFAPQNLYYLTGYMTIGYYEQQGLLVPLDGEPTFILRLLEKMNATHGSWVKKIATYADHEDPIEVMAKAIKDEGLVGKTLGADTDAWMCRMTHYAFEKLKKLLEGVNIKPLGPFGKGPIERCRLIKSEREIDYIRRAAKIASKAMREGVEAVREGVNENEVAAEVWRSLLVNGSEFPALQPFVVGGPRSAMTHAYYAGRTLRKGDLVFFEIGASVKRYHGACVRSASVGEPKEKIRRIAELSKNGLDKAVEAVRPGVTSHEVDKACWEDLVKAGLGEYRHRCGYSIGIEWGEGDIMSLRENDPSILKPGMVFHMPGPTIMLPGEGAIGFSETVLVTEDGHEVLTEVDRELFIR